MCVFFLSWSVRVEQPFQDGILTAKYDVVNVSSMVAALETETILKAKKNATMNVFVTFLKLQGFVWVTSHHGFIIQRRKGAKSLFTEDVMVMRTDFIAKKDAKTVVEVVQVFLVISSF